MARQQFHRALAAELPDWAGFDHDPSQGARSAGLRSAGDSLGVSRKGLDAAERRLVNARPDSGHAEKLAVVAFVRKREVDCLGYLVIEARAPTRQIDLGAAEPGGGGGGIQPPPAAFGLIRRRQSSIDNRARSSKRNPAIAASSSDTAFRSQNG